MNWSAFGSYEHVATTWLGPAYVVSARCDEGCHVMKHVVNPEELDAVRYPEHLFVKIDAEVKRAFAKVHP